MHKHIFSLLIGAILTSIAFAQSPSAIPYQAIARDSFSSPLVGKHISLRFTIYSGSSSGTTVYQETDTTTTDRLGLFTIDIGTGTVTSGTFGSIAWGVGSKYLQVEVDPAGGTSFTSIGVSQLMSVPYALYAQNSGTVTSKQIAYSNASGAITGDANFTRDSVNTICKVVRGNHYYQLSLGDSNTLDVGSIVNVPSAALVYGEVGGAYTMTIGAGNVPAYGLEEVGFLNLSDSAGDYASVDFEKFGGIPGIIASASYGSVFTGTGPGMSLLPSQGSLIYKHNNSDMIHGITVDSLALRIYSSPTSLSWTWPNTDGTNGQPLVTTGSGGLGFTTIGGKGSALGNHNIYGGNGLSTDTFNIIINKNHIYDPGGGAVSTLRIILPSGPSDGDIFLLTFEKAVTTIVYLNGTVAGGALTTAVPGSQKIYTYYSGTSKWY